MFLTALKNYGSFWLSVLKAKGHSVKFKHQVRILLKSTTNFWVHTNIPIQHAQLCWRIYSRFFFNRLSSLPTQPLSKFYQTDAKANTGQLCQTISRTCRRSCLKKKTLKNCASLLTHWVKSFVSDFEICT